MDTQPIATDQQNLPVGADYSQSVLPSSSSTSHILPIILSSLVTIFILVGGYFLFMSKSPKYVPINPPMPTPSDVLASPTPIADPTANWKTYTNNVHKISFKYPTDWTLSSKDDQEKFNASVNLTKDEATIHMIFGVDGIGGAGADYEGDSFVLDGNNVFKYNAHNTYNNSQTIGITDSLKGSLGVLMLKKKTYILNLNYPSKYNTSGESINLEQIFDQILSTFKFIN